MKEVRGNANFISHVVDIVFYIVIITLVVIAVVLILRGINWPGVFDLAIIH